MTVTPGLRLGPYEIASAVGAGGMGEVWRAKDTRLDRDVAIKILPAAFAENVPLEQTKEPGIAAAGEGSGVKAFSRRVKITARFHFPSRG